MKVIFKLIQKYKKIIVISGVFLSLLLGTIIIKKDAKEIKKETNYFTFNYLDIENRVSLFNEDILYIGENKKEIENGYYDIKLLNTKEGVLVYLNKLWYEKFSSTLIDEEYLAKICKLIVNNFSITDYKEELEYTLFNYIKENYLKVRNNEKAHSISVDYMLISLSLEKDGTPKLEIKEV